jgi:hypothetical protein
VIVIAAEVQGPPQELAVMTWPITIIIVQLLMMSHRPRGHRQHFAEIFIALDFGCGALKIKSMLHAFFLLLGSSSSSSSSTTI